jgi:hypothetical protein
MATAGNISGSEFATEFVSIEDRGSPTRVHGDEDIAGSHHERLAVRGGKFKRARERDHE